MIETKKINHSCCREPSHLLQCNWLMEQWSPQAVKCTI